MTDNRQHDLIGAFVALATSLADGEDVVELLTGLTADCARLLNIESAGLLLADARGVLHLLASSSDATSALEGFQLQRAEGPCLDCYHSGQPVSSDDLSDDTAKWPQFAPAAIASGFLAVHALPMRLRDTRLGALGLFSSHTGPLSNDDRDLAQALAHVASVALVHGQMAADKDVVVAQLSTALNSRVVIEQAKGVIAEKGDLEMDQAFSVMRRYARDNNERLSDLAAAIVSRQVPAATVLTTAHASRNSVHPA